MLHLELESARSWVRLWQQGAIVDFLKPAIAPHHFVLPAPDDYLGAAVVGVPRVAHHFHSSELCCYLDII